MKTILTLAALLFAMPALAQMPPQRAAQPPPDCPVTVQFALASLQPPDEFITVLEVHGQGFDHIFFVDVKDVVYMLMVSDGCLVGPPTAIGSAAPEKPAV